jgi:hypothetical protein
MAGISSFKNIQPNNLIDELIGFIKEELPNFTSSNSFVEILVRKKNEDQHSTAFCNFMNFQQKDLKFNFIRESNQKGNRTVDLGIYLKGGVLLFTLEAKVLPTPHDSKRNIYEYVYGDGGGIQRFRDENHGLDNHEQLLLENGIIAYIKENNFEHWHSKINQWIIDASWPPSEKLSKPSFSKTASLESIHTRKSGSILKLFHFWVKV